MIKGGACVFLTLCKKKAARARKREGFRSSTHHGQVPSGPGGSDGAGESPASPGRWCWLGTGWLRRVYSTPCLCRQWRGCGPPHAAPHICGGRHGSVGNPSLQNETFMFSRDRAYATTITFKNLMLVENIICYILGMPGLNQNGKILGKMQKNLKQ